LQPEQDDLTVPIIGYVDNRVSVGLERVYYRLFSYVSHNVQVNVPFYYWAPGEKDSALKPVTVSYPALTTNLDLRDDAIHPHRGLYLGNELEVAGVGGDARDVKIQPEVRAYLPVTRRITLAMRGSIGLLFAQNYGDTVLSNALTGGPPADTSRTKWVKDVQLMFLRGLFAGGAGSNRGYGIREIGPHGAVPFYNNGQSMTQGVEDEYCRMAADPKDEEHRKVCDLPLGGFTLWEASIELRVPLAGALSGTLFTDAADVSPRRLSFRARPHLSSGFGIRYDTPVGPIRLDLGFRLPGLQAPKNAQDEGRPEPGFFGLPMAASFGIGESF
jgi:outer membrane protein insertion porin family/translocation and assembly module TamA